MCLRGCSYNLQQDTGTLFSVEGEDDAELFKDIEKDEEQLVRR